MIITIPSTSSSTVSNWRRVLASSSLNSQRGLTLVWSRFRDYISKKKLNKLFVDEILSGFENFSSKKIHVQSQNLKYFWSKNARPKTISSSKNNFSTQLQKLSFSNFQLNLRPNASHAKSWDIWNHKRCKSKKFMDTRPLKFMDSDMSLIIVPYQVKFWKLSLWFEENFHVLCNSKEKKFPKTQGGSERLLALSSETNTSTKAL